MDKEQQIIKKYFKPLAKNVESLGLENDSAFLKKHNLVISTDMMIEDKHFEKNCDPKLLAKKLLRINLSDIAAMGAYPFGFFLNIALPKNNLDKWLTEFCKGLKSDMRKYNIKLFGGDTSSSDKIFLNVTILGKIKNQGLCHVKNFAKNNSSIYVTGNIGDAALGFCLQKNYFYFQCSNKNKQKLIKKFNLPEPRLITSQNLLGKVDFCTDISDGLLRELHQIANHSNKCANIFLENIPLSNAANEVNKKNKDLNFWEILLSGGEDYELLFSLSKDKKIKKKKPFDFTYIGYFSKGKGLNIIDKDGNRFDPKKIGFSHF